jgi:hypothetical protein
MKKFKVLIWVDKFRLKVYIKFEDLIDTKFKDEPSRHFRQKSILVKLVFNQRDLRLLIAFPELSAHVGESNCKRSRINLSNRSTQSH